MSKDVSVLDSILQEGLKVKRPVDSDYGEGLPPNMKVVELLKMIACFFLLTQYHTISARPHVSGSDWKELHDQLQQMKVQKQASVWWSEDYSLPRRRRPIHNKLEP